AAAERQRLRDVAQQHLPARLPVRSRPALEAAYVGAGDETVAVDAHEAVAVLLLQLGQGLLEQVFARRGAYGDVLELGLQVDDLVDRHEEHARALGDREEAPRVRRQLLQRALGEGL